MAHWTRKSYTNVKVQLLGVGVTPYTLAAMDSAFMFTYAGGSFITGMLGDNFSPVTIIAIGLLGSSAVLLLMVFGASTSIASTAGLCAIYFTSIQAIHGFFQATGGPVNTVIVNNWWPKEGRGKVFGFWTCHQYVGDIIAAFASAYILGSSLDWRYAIIIPLVLNGLWSIMNFMCVPNDPSEFEDNNVNSTSGLVGSANAPDEDDKPIGFCEAFSVPNVAGYALAFGFFKLINYAMFFQLPFILAANFDPATSNIISSLYSFGMMPGGIVCGWVSDVFGARRACVCAFMMSILMPLMIFFGYFMDSMRVELLLPLLMIMGCLVGGPNNIITSAVAADLAETVSGKACGTITGIINGSGSVTAAFGQMLIPILYDYGKARGVGYRYVWFFLVLCAILGNLLMLPKIIKEISQDTDPQSTKKGYQSIGVELKNAPPRTQLDTGTQRRGIHSV
uniref:Major facilitator superfamily (MFS) profile domain-containing protein n=1 Tax=Octactis speculum TaxID=3111310 RepID=A0A7S2CJV4_9STRA